MSELDVKIIKNDEVENENSSEHDSIDKLISDEYNLSKKIDYLAEALFELSKKTKEPNYCVFICYILYTLLMPLMVVICIQFSIHNLYWNQIALFQQLGENFNITFK